MADTDTLSEEEKWGFTPDAPAVEQAQAPPQEERRPPTQLAQAAPPAALDTRAPPQMPESAKWGLTPPPASLGQIDDNAEYEANRKAEVEAFKNRLSIIGNHEPLPPAFRREQHPEFAKLSEAEATFAQLTDKNEIRRFKPQVDALRKRIDHEVQVRDQQARITRREQLANADAPYTSPENRARTADVISKSLGDAVTANVGNLGSRDPAIARQADYDLAVSPLTTLSRPKPGMDPKAKPDGTNRDYTALRDAVTDISVHNRGVSNEAAVNYVLKIGTPGGGTDEKGNNVVGYNGRYGAGATNYKVIGSDDLDNVMVQMNDGKVLRVPGQTFRQLMIARLQGVQRAKQWEIDYKKSQEPGILGRVLKSVIPEKGF